MAVVAVCIAYEQFCVTQCGMTGIYAVLQNYVADFACSCGYFAVFIYGEVVVCTIECTVTVYEERHNTVFICSTYGQVVFCVQGIGLDGVYTGNVAFFIDSYLTKLSGFRSDLAVVAVCIAYEQFCVTQCGMTGIYAVLQNYVADFACSCGYFAVFIYGEVVVCTIECTVTVYEERHNTVFICSTYGQVVFCVQGIGLDGVYTGNVAVLIKGYLIVNLNIAAIQNDGGSAVGDFIVGYVDICQFCTIISIYAIFGYNSAGSFDSTVGTADAYIFASQIAKHDILVHVNLVELLTVNISFFNIDVVAAYYLAVFACFGCYCMQLAAVYCVSRISGYCACCYTGNLTVFSNSYFAQLSTFSGDLAVVAACIAYKQLAVTQCRMTGEYTVIQYYVTDFAFGCGYFAVFIYNQFAVGSIECAVAVYEERHGPIYICSAYGQIVFGIQCIGLNGVCICITIFIYREFAVCCIKCAVAVYEERRSTICFCSTYCYAACCYTAACPDSAFAAADAYKSVRIISCKSNIIFQSNLILHMTICSFFRGYSNISTISNNTVLFCFCFYIFQLAYVYSISIFSTCCYIDNLTVSVSSAYGYCISSVSYAAGTQSNTACIGNFGIMTENNSVTNSCFGYFISRAENNVILTAYLVIITDNLVAVCGNFIFNTDYSNIRCIGNSVLITVNKVILCSLSFSTGYFILYAGQLGVFSVISLVAAADCHYRTTCIFAGLHSFNCFLLCSSNRKLIPAIIININAFNRVGNFVAGTPD